MLWGLRPVEPLAAYGVAVDRLRRQIHSGLLLPAEKLPAERKLSIDFGISRVTLREALRVLETDHYINIKRGAHGGAFVVEADNLVNLSKRRLSREPATAMRVLEFLCINEIAAVRFAANRHGVPELKRMKFALSLMRAAEDSPQLKQAETYFHMAVGEAAHNSMLGRAIEDTLSELFLPYSQGDFSGTQKGMIDLHQTLFDAIESHDGSVAENAVDVIHQGYWEMVRGLTRSAA